MSDTSFGITGIIYANNDIFIYASIDEKIVNIAQLAGRLSTLPETQIKTGFTGTFTWCFGVGSKKPLPFLRVGPHLPPWSSFAVHMPWVVNGRWNLLLPSCWNWKVGPNLWKKPRSKTYLQLWPMQHGCGPPQEADLDLDFTCFHLRLCLELLWQEHDEA